MTRLTENKYRKKLQTLNEMQRNLIEARRRFREYYKQEPDYCTCYKLPANDPMDCDSCLDLNSYYLVIGCLEKRKDALHKRYNDEQLASITVRSGPGWQVWPA